MGVQFGGNGLKKVQIRDLGTTLRLKVLAKGWFIAGASQPAANTRLTITIGSQCFSNVVTRRLRRLRAAG
mgnify:CR=1 FL=1